MKLRVFLFLLFAGCASIGATERRERRRIEAKARAAEMARVEAEWSRREAETREREAEREAYRTWRAGLSCPDECREQRKGCFAAAERTEQAAIRDGDRREERSYGAWRRADERVSWSELGTNISNSFTGRPQVRYARPEKPAYQGPDMGEIYSQGFSNALACQQIGESCIRECLLDLQYRQTQAEKE